jgi:hypothetical protein
VAVGSAGQAQSAEQAQRTLCTGQAGENTKRRAHGKHMSQVASQHGVFTDSAVRHFSGMVWHMVLVHLKPHLGEV